jgi:N-acetyl-gamma-glutamyl-phosphate reductase
MTQTHKHVPEMQRYAGLARAPIFAPSVGRYYKGMIVEVPLPIAAIANGAKLADVHGVLEGAYEDERFVSVASLEEARALKTLDPEALNGTNELKLFVFGHDEEVRLVALLDNLGKGASGAAVQNLNLALGLDEGAGL